LPETRYVNRPWEFWQFTTTGRVPGIKGDVDRNAFFGGEAEFAGWRNGEYDIGTRRWTTRRGVPPQPSPGPERPEPPPVATIPGGIAPVSSSFQTTDAEDE
jgi:lysozyme